MERRITYQVADSTYEISTSYSEGTFRTVATENGSPVAPSRIQATAPADLHEDVAGAFWISGIDRPGRPANLISIQEGLREALRTDDPANLSRISHGGMSGEAARSACKETRDRLDGIFGHPTRTARMADLCWAVAAACDGLRSVRQDGPLLLLGARERDVRLATTRLAAFAGRDFASLGFPTIAISSDTTEGDLRSLRRHAAITFSGLMGRQLKEDVYARVSRNVAEEVLSTHVLPTCLKEWRRKADAVLGSSGQPARRTDVAPDGDILIETTDEFVLRMATRRGGPEIGGILKTAMRGDEIELEDLHSIGSVLESLSQENPTIARFVVDFARKISLKENTFDVSQGRYSEDASMIHAM